MQTLNTSQRFLTHNLAVVNRHQTSSPFQFRGGNQGTVSWESQAATYVGHRLVFRNVWGRCHLCLNVKKECCTLKAHPGCFRNMPPLSPHIQWVDIFLASPESTSWMRKPHSAKSSQNQGAMFCFVLFSHGTLNEHILVDSSQHALTSRFRSLKLVCWRSGTKF